MLLPDLKHILVNIMNQDGFTEISPIEVNCVNIMSGKTKLMKIEKRGKSYKISDIWNNEWTISSLPRNIQGQIKTSLRTTYDSRETFTQTDVYDIK